LILPKGFENYINPWSILSKGFQTTGFENSFLQLPHLTFSIKEIM